MNRKIECLKYGVDEVGYPFLNRFGLTDEELLKNKEWQEFFKPNGYGIADVILVSYDKLKVKLSQEEIDDLTICNPEHVRHRGTAKTQPRYREYKQDEHGNIVEA